MVPVVLLGEVMREERAGYGLRQAEHICGHGSDRKTFEVITSTLPPGNLG